MKMIIIRTKILFIHEILKSGLLKSRAHLTYYKKAKTISARLSKENSIIQ